LAVPAQIVPALFAPANHPTRPTVHWLFGAVRGPRTAPRSGARRHPPDTRRTAEGGASPAAAPAAGAGRQKQLLGRRCRG